MFSACQHRAVGKNMLASGQLADHRVQLCSMRQIADINVMDEM